MTPAAVFANAKVGNLSIRIGLGWAKSHTFATGQCPVMKYHRGLMQAILNNKVKIAKAVNATVISLDQGPKGYKDFDKGAAKKFVIDPHNMVAAYEAGPVLCPISRARPHRAAVSGSIYNRRSSTAAVVRA